MLKSLLLALLIFITHSLAQPNFVMNCTIYPDICDNTCNAVFCHSIRTTLHYDNRSNTDRPNTPASQTTAAGYRRNNVGCGGTNYCSGTGTDCDEYPYASTFDGGLGCIAARFNGTVAQSGTTRCANSSQNRSHGSRLAAFYRQNNLTEGSAFNIVFDAANVDNAPLCAAVRTGNTTQCPTNNGAVYRFRDAPLPGSFCPSRTNFTAAAVEVNDVPSAEAVDTRTIVDDNGREFIYVGATRPAVGSKIWTATDDGSGEESTVVA